jgi:hypothetical protein
MTERNDVYSTTVRLDDVLARAPKEAWEYAEIGLWKKLGAQDKVPTYYAEDLKDIEVPRKGFLVISWGNADDPLSAIVKDGKAVAGYYMSSRGHMYQAGCAVRREGGVDFLYCSNFREEQEPGEWIPVEIENIDARIALEALQKAAVAVNM